MLKLKTRIQIDLVIQSRYAGSPPWSTGCYSGGLGNTPSSHSQRLGGSFSA